MIIAHWTYSRDEWNSFHFRKLKRKSVLNKLINRARLLPKRPEVVFTRDRISIGDWHLDISPNDTIKDISLYQEGEVHVMRLLLKTTEVPILIPKGRLREALELRSHFRGLG